MQIIFIADLRVLKSFSGNDNNVYNIKIKFYCKVILSLRTQSCIGKLHVTQFLTGSQHCIPVGTIVSLANVDARAAISLLSIWLPARSIARNTKWEIYKVQMLMQLLLMLFSCRDWRYSFILLLWQVFRTTFAKIFGECTHLFVHTNAIFEKFEK